MRDLPDILIIWLLLLLSACGIAIGLLIQDCRKQGIAIKIQFSILEMWGAMVGCIPTFWVGNHLIKAVQSTSQENVPLLLWATLMLATAQFSGLLIARLDYLLQADGLEPNEWFQAGRLVLWCYSAFAFIPLCIFAIPILGIVQHQRHQSRHGH